MANQDVQSSIPPLSVLANPVAKDPHDMVAPSSRDRQVPSPMGKLVRPDETKNAGRVGGIGPKPPEWFDRW